MTGYRLIFLAGLAPAVLAATAASAQPPSGVTRTDLQRHALSVAGHEVLQVRVALAPGAAFPDHRHPGEEVIYVLEGSFDYRIGGGPPVRVEAGGVLFIPAGAVHSARNAGAGTAVELATYIVETGRPLLELVR